LKRPRFTLVNLSGIGYRSTSKLDVHSYSQSINKLVVIEDYESAFDAVTYRYLN